MPGWREHDQMERNLTMLSNLYRSLAEDGGLKHISLLQGTKAYGAHIEPMTVPGRERNPRHRHENFYWLQEDFLRDRQSHADFALTILRPQVIYGEAQGGNMNPLPALGVYAALLRAQGRDLEFPGGVAPVSEAVDADLLARMLEWAATSPAAANETFNVTNGDVYCLQNVWPVLAESFGMQVGDAVPMSLAAEMPGREPEWNRSWWTGSAYGRQPHSTPLSASHSSTPTCSSATARPPRGRPHWCQRSRRATPASPTASIPRTCSLG